MEKINEIFNPVYNNVDQVVRCVGYMLGEEVESARIAVVIGHNGRNFVSSTDWRLVMVSGVKRILTFAMRPQYPNFVECVAGVSYQGENGQFKVLPDEVEPRSAVVILEGKEYVFSPGEALKIYVEPNSRFIATDCSVICEDNGVGARVYRVCLNEETIYGFLDEKGSICRA